MSNKQQNISLKLNRSYGGIIAFIMILIAIVIFATFYNYNLFRDRLVDNEQEQLLTIASATAERLEQFIDEKTQDLIILREFVAEESLSEEDVVNIISQYLDNYIKIQNGKVYKIQFYNNKELLIYETISSEEELFEPSSNFHLTDSQFLDKSPSVGELIIDNKGNLYVDISCAVQNGENSVGYLKMIFELDDIYNLFVADIKIGEKGYASVKDSSGILLMHPKKEDLGTNVMIARKEEFPEYDWSELEAIVEKQKSGESGTGIYHSIWYHDEKKDRIKKFSAYAPAKIGDDFWIVTVSMDYKEFDDIASKYFYSNIFIAGFIPVVLTILLIYILNLKKNLIYLANEQKYLEKVNQLNIELEKDIEARKVLEKELLRSKSRFKQLFNAGTDLTFALKIDNKYCKYEIDQVNDMACERLSINREDIIGSDYLSLDGSLKSEDMEKLIEKMKLNGTSIFESELTDNNGVKIPVEISSQIFALDNRDMIMLVARDISKKIAQEEQLEKDRALLIYKFRLVAMGEMIANIAHQWRQPLGSLSLMLTNLEDAYDHDDMDEEYFRSVIGNSFDVITKMSEIIDEFRYFFNPTNEKNYFNPLTQLESSLEMVKDRISINEVEVNLKSSSSSNIYGYSNQFSQVILNIINNSIDAVKQNENSNRKISIHISDYEGENVKIEISNNGDKLLEGVGEKVFDPYFTTKGDDSGTGIGLYMTKMILETNFEGTISMMNINDGVKTEIIIPIGDVANE